MPEALPIAVQFGAGNIGRGFMGELFSRSGYHTRFVEVDPVLVAALRRRAAYEVHHITNEGDEPVRVENVSAIGARDREAVAEAVAGADLACTAVGVRALEAVAPALAAGVERRLGQPDPRPLTVITCENLVGAGRHLRDLVWDALQTHAREGGRPAPDERSFKRCIGFAEAVVSRMVPIVEEAVRRRDPLWIACEPYARLPVDAKGWRGPTPDIVGLEPVRNILAHQRRKLACHNMSHAVAAYLGHLAGHEFIWQAIGDRAIFATVRGALDETGRALVRRFGFPPEEQRNHEEDLLERYRNRALGDQVRRVAADPLRKLGAHDRLIGSARLCLEEDVDPPCVLRGTRAALAYDRADDPSAVRLQQMLKREGLEAVLTKVCGLDPAEPLFARLASTGGEE